MKNLILLILSFISITSKAQTLFGVSGGSISDANYQFDFSIGEPITAEIITTDNQFNIGFQQPYYDFFTSNKAIEISEYQLYPNPFSQSFRFTNSTEIEYYTFYDAKGKEVFNGKGTGLDFEHQAGDLPKGFYQLHVVLKNGRKINSKMIHQ